MWRTRIWARAPTAWWRGTQTAGACSVPDYAVIKLFRHIVQGEGPDTIVRGSTRRCGGPISKAGTKFSSERPLRQASRGRTVLSVSHRIYESLGGRTVEIRPQGQ